MQETKVQRREKGITLIALVVTIIVLLILAGVSIAMLTGENGILKRAKEAKVKTEIASEEEKKTLLKYEYEIAKIQGEISETETFGEYSMEREIKEKYGQDIKIGDTVNYDAGVDGYNGTWKVLGVEKGQILLMSSNPVKIDFKLKGKDSFLNLEDKLDGECKKYATGKVAESARSLRAEDINRISGYNPENPEKIEKYGKGTVAEYGTSVTFTLDNNFVKYECSNGQSLNTNLTSFEHVDGRKLDDKVSEITIMNNAYSYFWGRGDRISDNQEISLHTALSNGIKSLFSFIKSGQCMWLADDTIVANIDPSGKDKFAVYFCSEYLWLSWNGNVGMSLPSWRLYTSDGKETERTADVMAVVLLKPDVKLSKSENNIWLLNG